MRLKIYLRRLGVFLSNEERRAYVVLAMISALLALGAVLFSIQEQKSTERKFCQLMQAFADNPVPKPTDPKANPSRETNYKDYVILVNLGRSLGCDIAPVK